VTQQAAAPGPSGALPTYSAPAPRIQIPLSRPPSDDGSMEWLKLLFFLAAAMACGALVAYFFLR
jgi:hypothetical protein